MPHSKHAITEHTVSPPIGVQAGDRLEITATHVKVWRGAVLIATQLLSPGVDVGSGEVSSSRQLTSVFVVEPIPMPGQIATLTGASRNGESVTFEFAGGTERPFDNLQEALESVQYLDSDVTTCQDALILKSIRNSPDGANLENIIGASVSADFNANQPLVLTVD